MQTIIKITPNGECTIITEGLPIGQAIPAVLVSSETDSLPTIGQPWNGGKYAGISVGEDGQPDHPLALLSHKADKPMTWDESTKWAASFGDGARLPTKREAALLYANLPGEFDKSDWHWTSTPYSDSHAWVQYFNHGSQNGSNQSSKRLCRAVR